MAFCINHKQYNYNMSKKKSRSKTVVRNNDNTKETTSKVVKTTRTIPKTTAKTSRSKGRKTTTKTATVDDLLFTKVNYQWMIGGLVVIFIGLLLMSGGGMEDASVWDDSAIYGFRRTVLAPFLVLAGLVIEIFAIFKK